MQNLLRIIGVDTEVIRFKRQNIANESETIQNIYMAQGDLDRETRLKLNPMVQTEEIDDIMKRADEEALTGLRVPNVEHEEDDDTGNE